MNDDFQTKAETGRRLLDTLAGLRLTVTLLILSILLVFLGTLEQVHWGVWHIQKAYFGSWVCFYPLDDTAVARIPLPGGFLLGATILLMAIAGEWDKLGQILHGFDTLGLPKTISAAEALAEVNPGLTIVLHPEGFKPENAAELVARYDLVVDGTDNFATRFLAADACVLGRKPLVHGSVLRSEGQVGVFLPAAGCYRCVYPVMPDPASVPTCAEGGVFGATCGVIGSWMASEVIALLLGQRRESRLQVVDMAAGTSRMITAPSPNASSTRPVFDRRSAAAAAPPPRPGRHRARPIRRPQFQAVCSNRQSHNRKST